MWYLKEDGMLDPLMKDIPEAYNMPRQQLPKIYYQNANIDVIRPRVILEERSMSGKRIAGYVMSENYDIDSSRRRSLKMALVSDKIDIEDLTFKCL